MFKEYQNKREEALGYEVREPWEVGRWDEEWVRQGHADQNEPSGTDFGFHSKWDGLPLKGSEQRSGVFRQVLIGSIWFHCW